MPPSMKVPSESYLFLQPKKLGRPRLIPLKYVSWLKMYDLLNIITRTSSLAAIVVGHQLVDARIAL